MFSRVGAVALIVCAVYVLATLPCISWAQEPAVPATSESNAVQRILEKAHERNRRFVEPLEPVEERDFRCTGGPPTRHIPVVLPPTGIANSEDYGDTAVPVELRNTGIRHAFGNILDDDKLEDYLRDDGVTRLLQREFPSRADQAPLH